MLCYKFPSIKLSQVLRYLLFPGHPTPPQRSPKIRRPLVRLGSVFLQGLVQKIPVQAILGRETPSESLDILFCQILEVIHPFLNEELGDEDVPTQPRDPVRQPPDRPWVEFLVLLWDFFDDVVDEGLVDLFDMGVVCTPWVDGKTVFASEEVLEQGPVRCLWRYVDHTLESDILV